MRKLNYLEIELLICALVCAVALFCTLGALKAKSAEVEDLRIKLAEAEKQKVVVIEQAATPTEERESDEAKEKHAQEEPPAPATVPTDATPPVQTITVNQQEMVLVPPTESVGMKCVGTFTMTHYCTCTKCTNGDGIGASGRKVIPYYSIAVDPSVIPLGTVVYLDYGDGVLHEARADDTGGAVVGHKIDLCVGDHATAVQYGVRSAMVYVGGRQ